MTDAAVEEWIEDAREELIEFIVSFGNVSSPRGHEDEASQYLREHSRSVATSDPRSVWTHT
jgi:hypothetical protein